MKLIRYEIFIYEAKENQKVLACNIPTNSLKKWEFV